MLHLLVPRWKGNLYKACYIMLLLITVFLHAGQLIILPLKWSETQTERLSMLTTVADHDAPLPPPAHAPNNS